jgi:hypothetical protein
VSPGNLLRRKVPRRCGRKTATTKLNPTLTTPRATRSRDSLAASSRELLTEEPPQTIGRAETTAAFVLESGFGFEFFESDGDIVHLAMDVEPEEDFQAFFVEQLENLLAWQKRLPRWVAANDLGSYAVRSFAAFSYAVAAVAEEVGASGYSRADIYCKTVYTFAVAAHLAHDRLPDADPEAVRAELFEIGRHGLWDVDEPKAEARYREKLASDLETRGGLGAEIARRLRRERLIQARRSRWFSAMPRPMLPQRLRAARARAPRTRVSRVRCSRGDPSPDGPSSEGDEREPGGRWLTFAWGSA